MVSRERFRVVIVGCGFSGLAPAIRLKRHGIDDFVVLERADDIGGAWHHNTYQGCRCDVPSHLHSLFFAPNPEWSNTFSPQPEIREYAWGTADRFGIRRHVRRFRLAANVDSATYELGVRPPQASSA